MSIRVSIVEDNGPIREIMRDWIRQAGDMQLEALYPDAQTALVELPGHPVDVVLMDINMPGMSGIECVRQLKPTMPSTQFVMVTVYMDVDRIYEALSAGATGYLLKRAPRAELLEAIREVHVGGSPMSRNIARLIVEAFRRPESASTELDRLTQRELDVLRLLVQGHVYKEIADQLKVSFNTIHTLIRRIYEKLHVHTRREAVDRYHQARRPLPRK